MYSKCYLGSAYSSCAAWFRLYTSQGRRKRGGWGGLISPNSNLLKKMKEPRLALSTLLAHMLQAISDSLFSSILINLFPNF